MSGDVNIPLLSGLYLCLLLLSAAAESTLCGGASLLSPAVVLSFIRSWRQCDAGVGFPLCVCGRDFEGSSVVCSVNTVQCESRRISLPVAAMSTFDLGANLSVLSLRLTYLLQCSTSHKDSMLP